MDEGLGREPTSIDPQDVREEFTKASGAGGQNRNKRSTAVVLTHRPTGIKVFNADQRTQGQNRSLAWKRLEQEIQKRDDKRAGAVEEDIRRNKLESKRIWAWVEYRDSVTSPEGKQAKMSKVLKGRFALLQG